MNIIQEVGLYLNQSLAYNILESSIVVFGIAYWVFVLKLALED